MPQGSVLGPILLTLYTTPLGAIARKYQLNFHLYADDTQLYMSFKPNNAESLPLVISNIQNCVIDIKSWMTANMLQLNMDKTEVLVLMNKSLRNLITMNKIKIDSIDISTASSVRNLGVIFDSALSSEAFVNSICLVQFIQHQQKPKVSNNGCCQDPYPIICDVQNRLLQQPAARHPR